jgi:hypothetical protein
MPQFTSAIELLAPGETALVVFTDGTGLTDNHDGTGSTGWWTINPKRKVDVVIVYRRATKDQTDNDVFIGHHDGIDGPLEDCPYPGHRYLVRLRNFKLAGHTHANWRQFADTFMRPVRYVSRPAAI